MKFENKNLTSYDATEVISGKDNDYPCFVFNFNQLDNVSGFEDFIGLTSYPRPINKNDRIGVNTLDLERVWVSIGFYKNLNEFFQMDFKEFEPQHFWLISINSEMKDAVIRDIKINRVFKV